ncbi:MAG: type II toxin-antitoxin system VapC family toxin [Alphaproteobacteria bacterium]|nr:type II toxin-antitoxin system VapC family toxin [Alphaproteobacteria bacterium]MBV9964158.1 type II toxin-antitoxin system VapC family toxin [Alphaproteobacteria bacterium]
MDVKVVDASALGAIIFKEAERREIAGRLEGAKLVAPALLGFEIVNACLTKLRRYPELRASILDAFLLQAGLRIEMADVDHTGILTLAEQFRLTGYDASYLWLAQRLSAELVTLDRQLARAAARLGLG